MRHWIAVLFKWLGLSIVHFVSHSQLSWCSRTLNLFLTMNGLILAVNPWLDVLLWLSVSIEQHCFFSAWTSIYVLVSEAKLTRCEHKALFAVCTTGSARTFGHISNCTPSVVLLHLSLLLVWGWSVVAVADCVEVLGITCTLNLNILCLRSTNSKCVWRLLYSL